MSKDATGSCKPLRALRLIDQTLTNILHLWYGVNLPWVNQLKKISKLIKIIVITEKNSVVKWGFHAVAFLLLSKQVASLPAYATDDSTKIYFALCRSSTSDSAWEICWSVPSPRLELYTIQSPLLDFIIFFSESYSVFLTLRLCLTFKASPILSLVRASVSLFLKYYLPSSCVPRFHCWKASQCSEFRAAWDHRVEGVKERFMGTNQRGIEWVLKGR